MQSSFIGSLMELSAKHEDVMYLTADSGEGGLDLMYRRNFPDRCFNFGIAEENMVAAASGMALCGKTPFVYTAAPFLVYRSYEFIRDDVCLQKVPVKIFGSGSGMTVSSLGPTHHSTEDIAVLRSIPNLSILSPATPKQAYESVKVAYDIPGPVYVRLGMNNEMEFFENNYHIPKKGMDVFGDGTDALVVTTGSNLGDALEASDVLKIKGKEITVLSIFMIKPFDIKAFIDIASKFRCIISVEEHNTIGGLGSMLTECLHENGVQILIIKLGLNDCFTQGYGNLKELRRRNGLDARAIASKIEMVTR